HLLLANRLEQARIRIARLAGDLAMQLAQAVARENATVEGIDEQRPRRAGRTHEEVTGERYVRRFDAGAREDLEQHGGERDGDADLAIEDVVEPRVARIVVVAGVAGEAELAIDEVERALEARRAAAISRFVDVEQRLEGACAERVQALDVRGDVEARVLVL